MSNEPGTPAWKGLFDWSIKFQDGTHPSDFSAEQFTPERREWLEAALKHYMQDFVDRMAQIKKSLDEAAGDGADANGKDQEGHGHSLEERENLLDELMDLVSSIDYARDLHKIGGLSTLLELLGSPQPSLRWRAAEVVATCMANNPPVQQWFLEGGVLPPLLELLQSDDNVIVRIKALLALSALVRHSDPCLTAFLHAGGLPLLVGSLSSPPDVRLQRKAMYLLQYILHTCPTDDRTVCELGALPALAEALQHGNEDGGTHVRQAALSVLLQLTSSQDGWRWVHSYSGASSTTKKLHPDQSTTSEGDGRDSLFGSLATNLISCYSQLSKEDQDAQREEAMLAKQLLQQLSTPMPVAVPAELHPLAPGVAGQQPPAQPMLLLGS